MQILEGWNEKEQSLCTSPDGCLFRAQSCLHKLSPPISDLGPGEGLEDAMLECYKSPTGV